MCCNWIIICFCFNTVNIVVLVFIFNFWTFENMFDYITQVINVFLGSLRNISDIYDFRVCISFSIIYFVIQRFNVINSLSFFSLSLKLTWKIKKCFLYFYARYSTYTYQCNSQHPPSIFYYLTLLWFSFIQHIELKI